MHRDVGTFATGDKGGQWLEIQAALQGSRTCVRHLRALEMRCVGLVPRLTKSESGGSLGE